jgi:hypothetical protein
VQASLKTAVILIAVASLWNGRGTADDSRTWHGGERRFLAVVDAHGRFVGPLKSGGVELTVNGAIVFVPIHRASGADGHTLASQYVWGGVSYGNSFRTSDCSGTPFIRGELTGTLRPATIVRQGGEATLYIAPDSFSSDFAPLVRSERYVEGPCATLTPVDREEGWTPESSFPLTQHYPEPLTVW